MSIFVVSNVHFFYNLKDCLSYLSLEILLNMIRSTHSYKCYLVMWYFTANNPSDFGNND
ncbi:MAG: hypothetical protein K0S71_2368 [Clostridia bacterium]|jgi:hypothetical protein|nr:hypothetical protein [Clostridia bacterium]